MEDQSPLVASVAMNAESSGQRDIFARALNAIRVHMGMDVAFISEFSEGRRVFRHVDAAAGKGVLHVGGSDALEDSVCARVADGRVPQLMPDACANAEAAVISAVRELPVGAHLSVPIRLSDARIYGTFCCFSCTPDHSLNERDLSMMRAFADVVAGQLERDLHQREELREVAGRIDRVLRLRSLKMVYQPIHNVAQGRIVGFEALARFTEEPARTPDVWFAEAARVGKSIELEMLAAELALEALPRIAVPAYISVNASPATLVEGRLLSMLAKYPLGRIMLEVTEHEAVEHYDALAAVLEPLRSQGLQLAIDDAGAGYASFRHILNLAPNVIKLDVSITRDIHRDRSRRALAVALAGFARSTGSRLVAEGVETADEWETLRRLGFHKAQGYFLGRPMPLDDAAALVNGRDDLACAVDARGSRVAESQSNSMKARSSAPVASR